MTHFKLNFISGSYEEDYRRMLAELEQAKAEAAGEITGLNYNHDGEVSSLFYEQSWNMLHNLNSEL